MSVWETLRKKRIWIAAGVTAGLLLVLWALGAALIESGTLSVKMQNGWIAGSSLCAGFLGGCMAREKQSGALIGAVTSTIILILSQLILSWIAFGGIDLKGNAWKNMILIFIGSGIAAVICSGRRGGTKKKAGKRAVAKMRKRR